MSARTYAEWPRTLLLPTGETRGFLEDGDEITLRGYCERAGFVSIGLGECCGVITARALIPSCSDRERFLAGTPVVALRHQVNVRASLASSALSNAWFLASQHVLDDFVEPDLLEGRSHLMLSLLPGKVNHQDRTRVEAAVARRLFFLRP